MKKEIDFSGAIDSMRDSIVLGRSAMQSEVAVSLYVFYSLEATDIAAMKVLRGVYASAGQVDCLSSDSPLYYTINRHMRASAKYFESLGAARLKEIMKSKKDAPAIKSITDFLAMEGIENFGDLEKKSGKPREKRTGTKNFVKLNTAHIKIAIPPEASAKELRELAQQLLNLAEERTKVRRPLKQNGERPTTH